LALLFDGGAASLALVVLSKGYAGWFSFFPAFTVFILSAAAISSGIRLVDRKTIATFRRAQALLFAGVLLWLLIAAVGAAYAWSAGSQRPLTNAMLFGAFTCTGLEFLVINGAFVRNAGFSLAFAALHPISTLLIVRFPDVMANFDPLAASFGAAALAIMVAFPALLKRTKTSLGHDALSLFQAFMKTWTGSNADDLERIIADHSEEVEVDTKVLRFKTREGSTFLVFPGVHPGPFHPVGSYDLPGVVSRAFKDLGPVMTLHGPGGHERNLATREETQKYASMVSRLARSMPHGGNATIHGPIHAKVGKATVSATAFSTDLITTISFAPLGSDDIDASVKLQLATPATEAGFELSVVDAHNSIDSNLESPQPSDPGWRALFEALKESKPRQFQVGYSHSNELGFKGGSDLTENGIGLLLVQTEGLKSVLVLADANNSVPGLRAEVERALDSGGYSLIELCTSDSHNLAARGLTVERGYEALGEATTLGTIANLVVKLAKLAETRLAIAEYSSAQENAKVRIFGSKALEEFAAITQSSSKFSRRYLRFAASGITILLLASIFL
jgi:putative membrane protein